jgi:hypothetical protein
MYSDFQHAGFGVAKSLDSTGLKIETRMSRKSLPEKPKKKVVAFYDLNFQFCFSESQVGGGI